MRILIATLLSLAFAVSPALAAKVTAEVSPSCLIQCISTIRPAMRSPLTPARSARSPREGYGVRLCP